MLLAMRSLLWSAAFLAAALAVPLAGCGPVPTPPPHTATPESLPPILDVSDDAFSAALYRVLRDGNRTPERQGTLAGVVRRQLTHAAKRFALGADVRGTDSTIGALYLLRLGEGRGDMIDPIASDALKGAMIKFGARGDEGRGLVLLTMRAAALPAGSPERAEVEQHLLALERWVLETRKGGPAEVFGADERAKVSRALMDPSEAAVSDAASAIGSWLDQAAKYESIFRTTGQRPERDEAPETFRALRTAAPTLAGLHLRYGDAKGAVKSIGRFGARRFLSPLLYDRLRRAADVDGPREWQALASVLAHATGPVDEDDENAIETDPEVAEASLWGVTIEAYRRDPAHFPTAALLAAQLVRFGMSEAVPLVMSGALEGKPQAVAVAASMELLLSALDADNDADDVEACRRTFQAAAPLLAAADAPALHGFVEPPPSRARFFMASVEMRAGNLAAARPLLEAAAKAEPSVGVFIMLAMIERQADNKAGALAYLERSLAAPDVKYALLDLADAYMLAYEIHRDAGSADAAKAALGAALGTVVAVRKAAADTPSRLRAERLLAHVLDAFGDAEGSARAMDRAIQIAGEDRMALSATVLDAIGHAFVRKDLNGARAALRKGLDADIREEELVYGGLWVQFLERELKATSDGTAEMALRRATGRGAWTGKLAAWAGGRMNETDLANAAQSASQRIEAAFYTAMAHRAAGDPAAETRLRDVAKSPILELLEVQLAREILAPRKRTELPRGITIP
jgi:tetratricopeptide (TPR) repeat protein